MITHKELCLFALTTDISPKRFLTLLMISDITAGFLCDSLLSCTYKAILNCVT